MFKKNWPIGVAALLILWFSFSLIWQGKNQSLTSDEVVHLPAGYTYITNWDYRINPEHPVLVKMWAALPWAIYNSSDKPSADLWQKSGNYYQDNWVSDRKIGQELIYSTSGSPEIKIFLGRIMMSILSIGFILLFSFFIFKKFGKIPALFSLALCVFNPQFLGYGHLVLTDIAIAATSFLSIILFSKLLEKQTYKNAILWGLSLGLAALTKYTVVIFITFFILIYFWGIIFSKKKIQFRYLFIGLIIGYLIVAAAYLPGKNFIPNTITNADIASWQNVAINQELINKYNEYSRFFVAPAYYIKGVIYVILHAENGHTAYLMGMMSKTGWRYYFPVAFILKNSIFLLLIIGTLFFSKKYWKNLTQEEKIVWSAFVFYWLLAINSKANLGIRHLMPIYPMLFFLIAAEISKMKNKKVYTFVIICTILYCISSLRFFPNYINYFSEIIGNSQNASKYLVDSNLDWGQDLPQIANFQRNNNIDKIYLEYFWTGEEAIAYYGINYETINADSINNHGYFVIGASALRTDNRFIKFKNSEPYKIIDNSVFIYKQ